ncbi:phage protein [Pantoea eucalypti]|uniref:phage protein n=1 Tax=Pantoea eucalypti TaxID=470933 RepID=UPI002898CCD3|nr:phage protein [Pantoea eucalypti]
MLKPIKDLIGNPQDLPDVPSHLKEHLQASFSHTYLRESGLLKKLRTEGHSESFIAGVIEGFAMASSRLDEVETRKALLIEEDF